MWDRIRIGRFQPRQPGNGMGSRAGADRPASRSWKFWSADSC